MRIFEFIALCWCIELDRRYSKFISVLQVPDEKSRFGDLHFYNAEDLIITLPTPMSVYDINFLSVYKEEVRKTKPIK